MIEVNMGQSKVSRGLLKSHKFYDCVGAVVMGDSHGLLGHVPFNAELENLADIFGENLNFFNGKTKGLVLGGIPRVVRDVGEYLQSLGVDVVSACVTKPTNGLWPRRDIHFMPVGRLVHYHVPEGVREYLL